jgi:hypothetical protein
MQHSVKFSVYITVEAEDEDKAYELAEKMLNEYAVLPAEHADALINILEYEDTFQSGESEGGENGEASD